MRLHYYPLVNKIINRLNLQDKLAFLDVEVSNAFPRPFITVAREPGSGGAPIGREVAKKLGFVCVDEQIIDQIARSTKKRKSLIQSIDEKNRSIIDDLIHSVLNEEYVDDLKYVQELVKVILTYAHQGNVVIIGRGANFITPFAKGLHVNVTAPYRVRVERAMEYEGLNEPQAKERIAKVESERKMFVKQYFRRDINRPNSYDLTINTTAFDMKQASDLIVDAFTLKFSRLTRYSAIFTK